MYREQRFGVKIVGDSFVNSGSMDEVHGPNDGDPISAMRLRLRLLDDGQFRPRHHPGRDDVEQSREALLDGHGDVPEKQDTG